MAKGTNGTGTVYKPKHPSKNLPFRAEVWITDLTRPSGKRRISKNFKKKSQAEAWREETVRKYGSHNGCSVCDPEINLVNWLTYWLHAFCINKSGPFKNEIVKKDRKKAGCLLETKEIDT